MSAASPSWGGGSRFFLPNEDAATVRAALRRFRSRVRRPVFVGGSGMVLLEGASVLPRLEQATFVDIADFQLDYFRVLLRAVEQAANVRELRRWFADQVYPELHRHFLDRGQDFALEAVLGALKRRFGVDFFFHDKVLAQIRGLAPRIRCVRADIVSHMLHAGDRHDFVYLSNVPDYLPGHALSALAAACRAHEAPVYLLLTTACPDQQAVTRAFAAAGYEAHPVAEQLNARNRGLGSPELTAAWNRPGRIHVFSPTPHPGSAPCPIRP